MSAEIPVSKRLLEECPEPDWEQLRRDGAAMFERELVRSDEFEIYSWGLVSASVCTTLPIDEATKRLNVELPTGIDSLWSLAEEDHFADGSPMPAPCNKGRNAKHYLFHC